MIFLVGLFVTTPNEYVCLNIPMCLTGRMALMLGK